MCAEVISTCPVIITPEPYWKTPPPELGPGEAALDVTPLNSLAMIGTSQSREYAPWFGEAVFGEQFKACTAATLFVVYRFRVNAVVRGTFAGDDFVLISEAGGCGSTHLESIIGYAPPDGADHGMMVVRPWRLPKGVSAPGAAGLRIMRYRSLSESIPSPDEVAAEAAY